MGFFPFYYFSECIYHWGLMGIWPAQLVWMFFHGAYSLFITKFFLLLIKVGSLRLDKKSKTHEKYSYTYVGVFL